MTTTRPDARGDAGPGAVRYTTDGTQPAACQVMLGPEIEPGQFTTVEGLYATTDGTQPAWTARGPQDPIGTTSRPELAVGGRHELERVIDSGPVGGRSRHPAEYAGG